MRHIDYYLDIIQKKTASGTGGGGITPVGTKVITTNGKHDVTTYAEADVQVPIPEAPSGKTTISITENGVSTHDVTAFAQAEVSVNVPVPAEPAGEKVVTITQNGEHTEDVKAFATAQINVNVPSTGITPQGTKEIQIVQNGETTEDVSTYKNVHIVTAVPEPAGTKEITQNGTHDVKSFASVNVNVPSAGGGAGVPQEKYDDLVSLFTFSNQNVHLVNEDMTSLCPYAFYYRTNLVSAILNGVTNVEYSVFQGCSKLSSIEMNSVETIGNNAFLNASALQEVVFPKLSEIGSNVFSNCSALKKVKCDKATAIQYGAFTKCPALEVIDILGGRQIAMFTNDKINSLKSFVIREATRVTPLSSGIFGFSDATTIYVADNLVEEYKVATNWSRYADKIKPLSEYKEV